MKRFILPLILIALVVTTSSCSHKHNPYRSPKTIAKAFAENLYTGKFDEAKTLATPESEPIINFFQHAFPPEHFEGCDHIDCGEITVTNTSDSTAICKFIVYLCNGTTGNEATKVIKRDGKWYVSLRDINGGGNVPAGNGPQQ